MKRVFMAIAVILLVVASCAGFGDMSQMDPCRLLGVVLNWVRIISESQFVVPDSNIAQFGANKFFFQRVITDLGPYEDGRRYQVDGSCGSLSTLAERAQAATTGSSSPSPITLGIGSLGVLVLIFGLIYDLKIFGANSEPAGA